MFYVVKPLYVDLYEDTELKIFRMPKAAIEYVNKGPDGADICEVWRIEAANEREAIEKFKAGQGERHTMHRRLSKQEIEEEERRELIAFLRDLGL